MYQEDAYSSVVGTTPYAVFGTPLGESLKCASVQISTAGNGGLYVYGYIPVVVAKWYGISPRSFLGDPWLISTRKVGCI